MCLEFPLPGSIVPALTYGLIRRLSAEFTAAGLILRIITNTEFCQGVKRVSCVADTF